MKIGETIMMIWESVVLYQWQMDIISNALQKGDDLIWEVLVLASHSGLLRITTVCTTRYFASPAW